MFKSRVLGIFQVFTTMQIIFIALLYWVTLWFFREFYHSDTFFDYERYGIVCALMMLTLLLTWAPNSTEKTDLFFPSVYSVHNESWRKTLAIFVVVLVFIFATKNTSMSRVFLFGFLPLLYLTLFLTRRILPQKLAEISFKGNREHRTLICGTSYEVSKVKYCLDR
jgi:hypothetical protein